MREIVLDTETTGLNPLGGDRIVEVAGVELMSLVPTGRVFHSYFNPERDMPKDASKVHGLTDEFLADKPLFAAVVDSFLEFIGDAPLVIHNAPFDMGFLNAELARHGFRALPMERAIDTLPMARRKFPGQPNSLDALCKRFGVDLSEREWHGALLDARLLADVYLELRGGRQPGLGFAQVEKTAVAGVIQLPRVRRAPRVHRPSEVELTAHEEFLNTIKNPVWKRMGAS